MEIINKIKAFLLSRKKTRLIGNKQRVLKCVELANVKTIGVVFDASNENKYKRSAHLIRHFSSMNKEVKSLAITNTIELPLYADNTLIFNYILKKEVNWFNFPKNKHIADFVNKEFDLLINLDFSGNETLNFIVNTSLAHLKVGLNNEHKNTDLDFMLEGIVNDDLNIFLKEILRYLEIIKTK